MKIFFQLITIYLITGLLSILTKHLIKSVFDSTYCLTYHFTKTGIIKLLFKIVCFFSQDSILAVPTISKLIALHDNYTPVSCFGLLLLLLSVLLLLSLLTLVLNRQSMIVVLK